MSSRRFNQIVLILILSYLLISLIFTLFPGFLSSNLVARIHNRYLMPGPFYTEESIVQTNYVLVSWKSNGHWTQPASPAMSNFADFFTKGNPDLLFQVRIEHSVNSVFIKSLNSKSPSKTEARLNVLKRFYLENYVPHNADSIRLIFLRKETRNFTTHIDTVYQTIF